MKFFKPILLSIFALLFAFAGIAQVPYSTIGQTITGPNTGTIKTEFGKVNSNFSYLDANATASGTDTYTAPAPYVGYAYTTNQEVNVTFTNANAGAATLNIASLGAKAIKKSGTSALSSGDIAAGQTIKLVYDGTNFQIVGGGGSGGGGSSAVEYKIMCSDLLSAPALGTNKGFTVVIDGMTVTSVHANLLTAQSSGSILTVDINEAGTSILGTKLTVDNNETTSSTAAAAATITDASIATNGRITIDIDQVGSGSVGLEITIRGNQ